MQRTEPTVSRADLDASVARGALLSDVAKELLTPAGDDLLVRWADGKSSELRWQAGVIERIYLNYRGQGMTGPVDSRIQFFRLLGTGTTFEEAVTRARSNKYFKNGK